jgi:hypothetical protein
MRDDYERGVSAMKPLHAVLTGLACLAIMAGTALAADKLPDNFSGVGTLDGVSMERGVVIINDISMRISMNVRVHTPDTQFGSYRSLKIGQKVGFNLAAVGDSRKGTVDEIWVLPKAYTPTGGRGRTVVVK